MLSHPYCRTVSSAFLHLEAPVLPECNNHGLAKAIVDGAAISSLLADRWLISNIDKDSKFTVYADIKPMGEKHPERLASQTRENDPVIRLGFRILMNLNNGKEVYLEWFVWAIERSSEQVPALEALY